MGPAPVTRTRSPVVTRVFLDAQTPTETGSAIAACSKDKPSRGQGPWGRQRRNGPPCRVQSSEYRSHKVLQPCSAPRLQGTRLGYGSIFDTQISFCVKNGASIGHRAPLPPSIRTWAPVMNEDASDARKRTTFAISLTSEYRPIGLTASKSALIVSGDPPQSFFEPAHHGRIYRRRVD